MSDIQELIRNSPFARSHYSVDIAMSSFHKGLMMFIDADKHENGFEFDDIFCGVPDFQRDNDKWSESMQVKFVENLLMGCKTTLMLYEVAGQGRQGDLCDCYILDGLQRITAIDRFVKGEISAFGEKYSKLNAERIISNVRCRLKLNIYTFSSEKEAIEFYISMNENITHSSSDIDKAKRILSEVQSDQPTTP